MHYSVFLLDLDHTLLDSDTSELSAFEQTLLAAGVSDPENHIDAYRSINLDLWAAVERGEICAAAGERHVAFERLASSSRVSTSMRSTDGRKTTSKASVSNGELYDGARDVLACSSVTQASLALTHERPQRGSESPDRAPGSGEVFRRDCHFRGSRNRESRVPRYTTLTFAGAR